MKILAASATLVGLFCLASKRRLKPLPVIRFRISLSMAVFLALVLLFAVAGVSVWFRPAWLYAFSFRKITGLIVLAVLIVLYVTRER